MMMTETDNVISPTCELSDVSECDDSDDNQPVQGGSGLGVTCHVPAPSMDMSVSGNILPDNVCPIDVFKLFFNQQVTDLFVAHTNLNSERKKAAHDPPMSLNFQNG